MPNCLVWLNWPERSFRVNAAALDYWAKVFPGSVKVVKTQASFLRALPQATHALVWEFDKAWFSRATKLKVLATPGAGRELLPVDDELPSGVVRVNGGFHGDIMAESVVAFMLAYARGLYRAYDWQREGVLWPRVALSSHCFCVAGTQAVILGYGKVGRAIGAKLEALGVRIRGFARANFNAFPTALGNADWLIAALPSDTGTDNLIDAKVLRRLPRRAVLINVGRGNCVDESTLVRALKVHRLSAACLDVYRHEPLVEASPLAGSIPNLYRLPHASAFSQDYMMRFLHELALNPLFGVNHAS